MGVVVVTGLIGLLPSECLALFAKQGCTLIGIESGTRSALYSAEAFDSGSPQQQKRSRGTSYRHVDPNIRDTNAINKLIASLGKEIRLIIHFSTQPSRKWAVHDPHKDFPITSTSALNMSEAVRPCCPEAAFIFTSSNKMYGDTPKRLSLLAGAKRREIMQRACPQGIEKSI